MDFREKLKNDRLAVFEGARPADITEEQWLLAKKHAEISGQKLSKEIEQSCYYYYVMGESWTDIASKLDITVGMLVYTGLSYEWHKRRSAIQNVKPGTQIRKAEVAAADLIADAIVATAAVFKHKLADVIKNPEKAATCPLIPRNVKELQLLLQLLEIAQPKKEPQNPSASVNVNIANVGNQPQVTANSANIIDALPPGEDDMPDPKRLEMLRMLKHVSVAPVNEK